MQKRGSILFQLSDANTCRFTYLKQDILSLGMILYEMMYQKVPLYERNAKNPGLNEFINYNLLNFHQLYSQNAEELCEKLLKQNPLERPNFSYIFGHAWLNDKTVQESFNQEEQQQVQSIINQGKQQQQVDMQISEMSSESSSESESVSKSEKKCSRSISQQSEDQKENKQLEEEPQNIDMQKQEKEPELLMVNEINAIKTETKEEEEDQRQLNAGSKFSEIELDEINEYESYLGQLTPSQNKAIRHKKIFQIIKPHQSQQQSTIKSLLANIEEQSSINEFSNSKQNE